MAKRYYDGPVSDHFDGLRFFNEDSLSADKSLWEVLQWSISRKAPVWPKDLPGRSGVKPIPSVAGLRITHIGHSSLLLQSGGLNILIDPVWAERASPVSWAGPKRQNPPAVAFDDLPPIHVVLVTHNHYDHMDVDTIRKLWSRDQPRIIVPLGNDNFIRHGHPEIVVETGDWWQEFDLPCGLKATMLPAYHWSSRKVGDYRKALWCGFMLETAFGLVYCSGDTAYRGGEVFREIASRFGPVLVALLPIGAYAPRYFMEAQHVDPEEATRIAVTCGARHVLGIHWGTFPLSDEPVEEPVDRLLKAVASTDMSIGCRPLKPGDVWDAQEIQTTNASSTVRSGSEILPVKGTL